MERPRIWVPPTLFQKLSEIFKNRFPRELDQKFGIPRISLINWIGSNFFEKKKRPHKKFIAIPYPGIQPTYNIIYNLYLKDFFYIPLTPDYVHN